MRNLALGLFIAACSGPATSDGGTPPHDAGSTSGVSVTVTPPNPHVAPGGMLLLHATLIGTTDTAVTWSADTGSIDASGLYQAPSAAGTYHVTATSHADPSASGSATVMVNTVGACASLPAAGTWEAIAPDTQDTDAIVVDPFDPATVWLGANNAGIFMSTDCGATFTHVNTGRNGAMLDHGGPISMAVDPVDRGTMYVAPIYGPGGVWKSTNGGVDWDQLFPVGSEVESTVLDNHFDSVGMDPHDHLHLVFGPHQSCRAPYDPGCEVVTTDGGATLRLVRSPAPGFEEGAGAFVLGATSWLYAGTHLWLTEDDGATFENLDPDPASWFAFNAGEDEIGPIVQGPDGTYYLASGQGIIRSSDGAHSWSLISGSGGSLHAMTMGSDRMFVSSLFSSLMRVARFSNPETWTEIPGPTGFPADQGCPYLQYDEAHHLLYASCFRSGMWRTVLE